MDAVLKYSYIQEASGNVKEKNNIKQKSEEVEGVLMWAVLCYKVLEFSISTYCRWS